MPGPLPDFLTADYLLSASGDVVAERLGIRLAYVRGGGGPIGRRVAGGGEPTRDSSPVTGDATWRGLNRQNTRADGQYGLAEHPTRESGDGSGRMVGGSMPSSIGGSVGSIKPRDASPVKPTSPASRAYRVQPPAPKPPTTTATPRTVTLSRDEIDAAIEMFTPLGYDRERAIRTYAKHKAEIQGKK